MDGLDSWRKLTSPDERVAEGAIHEIRSAYSGRLKAYLRSKPHGPTADVIEDLAQQVFIRLWVMRSRLVCDSVAACTKLLYRMADNCRVDMLRRDKNCYADNIDEAEPGTAPHEVADNVELLFLAELLKHVVNTSLLGLDAEISQEGYNRRLLAARLCLLDGFSADETALILSQNPLENEPSITKEVIQAWIADVGTLRLLAYDTLYHDPKALVEAILGIEIESGSDISNLIKEAHMHPPDQIAVNGLTWDIVVLAMLAYYLCESRTDMLNSKHEIIKGWNYSSAQILTLLNEIKEMLPYVPVTQDLMKRISPIDDRDKVLSAGYVWERLVFEHALEELPQLEILERIGPAASTAGYRLSGDTINSWLSGSRSRQKVMKQWKKHYGETAYA